MFSVISDVQSQEEWAVVLSQDEYTRFRHVSDVYRRDAVLLTKTTLFATDDVECGLVCKVAQILGMTGCDCQSGVFSCTVRRKTVYDALVARTRDGYEKRQQERGCGCLAISDAVSERLGIIYGVAFPPSEVRGANGRSHPSSAASRNTSA
jgi:hypothetical protein